MNKRSSIASLLLLVLAEVAYGKERAPLLGEGAHRYEWVSKWLKLPAGMTIGKTHGDVVIDARDRIYFSTDTTNALMIATPDGRIERVFGHGLGSGGHGLRLVKEGAAEVLWIAHLGRHEVIKLSLDDKDFGEELLVFPFPEETGLYKEKKEYVPTALDVAPNGDVYVVDGYGKGWLLRFDRAGKLLGKWNGETGNAGRFNQPHGVGIDLRGAEPRVVVADRQNHQLQLFTLDGVYVDAVTAGLRRPSKVVTRGDDLVVVDLAGRVTIFDKQYKVVAQLGDNGDPDLRGTYEVPPTKWKDGEFISPHGAAWDSKGNLYVQDWNAYGRMTKLRRVGKR